MNTQAQLVEWIGQASKILAFTGAGMSTASGIPDFRGPQGLWKKWRPVYFDEFQSSHESRVLHWDYKLAGWKDFRNAKPNAGHLALLELDRRGFLSHLVTQNIDGLHQLAGHSEEKVIELHGTNRKIECIRCPQLLDPDPVFEEFQRTSDPPLCQCGGFLKPATISFGQAMPYDKMERALAAASEADLVISIGSTLEVEPAASIPRCGRDQGARYVIINQGETAHEALADFRLEGDITHILPRVVQEVAAAFS